MSKFVYISKLKQSISLFRKDEKINDSHFMPTDQLLKNMQDKFVTDLDDMKLFLHDLPDLEQRCTSL